MLFPRRPKSAESEAARRERRNRDRRLFLLALFVTAALLALLMWLLLPAGDADSRRITLERQMRALYAAWGVPLPGTPNLADLDGRLAAKGMSLGAPIFMRIFKREFELEVWKRKGERFEHFATYPICRWSGRLGPKLATGDHQAPEGFYVVDKSALNPNSRWHRSFNLGFPNAFDRAHGRTGSFLMVHGGCSSVGCYAMTDTVIDEIWHIVTRAFDGGQKRFQVQVFPFRMTNDNLARYAGAPQATFWQNLKEGHDMFERDRIPPVVGVCGKTYGFQSGLQVPDLSGQLLATCPRDGSRTRDRQSASSQFSNKSMTETP